MGRFTESASNAVQTVNYGESDLYRAVFAEAGEICHYAMHGRATKLKSELF